MSVYLADSFTGLVFGLSIHPQAVAAESPAWTGEPQMDDRPGQSYTGQGGTANMFSLDLVNDQGNPSYPDGTGVIRIYAHQGTYGTSSAPLNAVAFADRVDPVIGTPTPDWIAESDALVFTSAMSSTPAFYDFVFSGANQIPLGTGTQYIAILSWRPSDTDSQNTFSVRGNTVAPGNNNAVHAGNGYNDGINPSMNLWGSRQEWDLRFRMYEATIEAMDTRNKRASSVQMINPFLLAPPAPDGTLDQADRQHIPHTYAGILASNPGASGKPSLYYAQQAAMMAGA